MTANMQPKPPVPFPAQQRNKPQVVKEPPYEPEAEQAVIGACLINANFFPVVHAFLKPDHFFLQRHMYIWRALELLESRSEPVDYLTVTATLRAAGQLQEVGGAAYITELINNTPTSIHAEAYGQQVFRAHMRRMMMMISDKIRALAQDKSIGLEDIIEQGESLWDSSIRFVMPRTEMSIDEATHLAMDLIEKARDGKGKALFVPTGFYDLDQRITGLERGKYHVLLAYTNMGKSLLSLQIALNMVQAGQRVLFLSNEMTSMDMTLRLLAMLSGVNSKLMRMGEMSEAQSSLVTSKASELAQIKKDLIVDYIQDLTPMDVKGKLRRNSRAKPFDAVFIDGIYKMSYPAYQENRVRELDQISQELMNLAKSTEVALFVSQQARKEIENRSNKRPTMGDSSWSHKIVRDADIVLGLHREGHYDENIDDPFEVEVNVLKGRDNATGKTFLRFNKDIPMFQNATRHNFKLND